MHGAAGAWLHLMCDGSAPLYAWQTLDSANWGGRQLELALEPFNVAGVLAQLLVGGALADAGQRPADGLRTVVRD
jgi:hypothetical protein